MNNTITKLRLFVLSFILATHSVLASTNTLDYEVVGLTNEGLYKNALSWLGQAPRSAQARSNFLFTAKEKVAGSLKALGYYQPEITLTLERAEPVWQLRIAVMPGEPVRIRNVQVTVEGDAQQDEAFVALGNRVPLVPGDVFNHATYDSYKRKVLTLGQRRGYVDARFTRSQVKVEPIGGTADIFLHYSSGQRYRFGAVNYDYQLLEEGFLEPLFTFREGDFYDQARVQDTQAILQRTGYFSTAIVAPDLADAVAGEVPLKLDLYAAHKHSFDLGVGFSTDTQERVSLTWRTPRLNRFGHSQQTRLQYSAVNPSARLTYSIPMSHPLDDVLQASLRFENNEFGDLDSDQIEVSLKREIKHKKWIYSYSLRGLNESWEGTELSREDDYLLPGFTLSRRDHSGSAVNPSHGFSQFYRLEAASNDLGSDVDLLRFSANFGFIKSLGVRHRVVSRVEVGAALMPSADRGDLAPSLNFFAGGSKSIRGFGYQSIGDEIQTMSPTGDVATLVVGGDRLATASIEYQHSFTPQWRGALFADAGDAFNDGDFELNYALGFGVHYVSPVGAVRLDIANPLSEDSPSWRIHLAIGVEF